MLEELHFAENLAAQVGRIVPHDIVVAEDGSRLGGRCREGRLGLVRLETSHDKSFCAASALARFQERGAHARAATYCRASEAGQP